MLSVFVSNASQYTGPGIVKVPVAKGYKVICHDRSFVSDECRARF